MAQTFASPSKYIQGYDELSRIKKHISHLGGSIFIVASKSRLADVRGVIQDSFQDTNVSLTFEPFSGECSKQEVERLREIMKAKNCDVIVGLGGGKVIDTAKAVAYYDKLPVAIVPTVASSDAPTSAMVIYYHENGKFQEVLMTRRNPNIVLVDTHIIAKAPVRLLVAGMGDALGTYFEARTCVSSHRKNFAGGTSTLASYELAKLCYKTLLSDGPAAIMAVENQVVTKALENIIEANTLLSGIGSECNGVSAAHSIYFGFTILPSSHNKFHGEWVAFGTIALLILENRPQEEIDEVVRFCRSVGLPTTLADLGLENISREDLIRVAQAASAPKESIHTEPFPVTADEVLAAILVADSIGRSYNR
jgi:glycerol dehydrogenase